MTFFNFPNSFSTTASSKYIRFCSLHYHSVLFIPSTFQNATAPSFTMSFYDSATNPQADEVSVLESTKVLIDMTTNRNVMYTKMDMEWLMPVDTNNAYMHVCKAEIESAGKNLPCLTPEWTNTLIEYESK